MDRHDYRGPRPSIFFPVALITVGVVWLLINNGVIVAENLYRLIPYWPVLLILAGLSLILRRIWWPLSAVMWLLAAAVFVLLLVYPPAFLPASPAMELKQGTFSEPVGQASSANVDLDLSVNPTNITVLEGSNDLISADLNYLGEIIFDTSGTNEKTIRLDQTTGPNFWTFRWDALIGQDLADWQIGLTPEIPLALTVDVSTGQVRMDFTGLDLDSLTVEGGTGSMEIDLPEASDRYPFTLNMSTGQATIRVPENATVDIEVDGGTGGLVIDVADSAGVQVDVQEGGIGSLDLPPGYEKVSEGDDDDEGVWKNEAYASTSTPLRIILDIGTGSVEIR